MNRTLLAAILSGSIVSAQATLFQYSVSLNGPNEPTTSLGIGVGLVNYNDATHTLLLQVTFFGLVTTNGTGVTASHLHAATTTAFTGTAGVATTTPTFAGFPSGVFGGSFSNTLDLTLASSWNSAYVTANGGTTATAEAALASAMATGKSYWNIHTAAFPGGEIRGFLVPTQIPEPSSLGLVGWGGIALGAFALGRRRVKSR